MGITFVDLRRLRFGGGARPDAGAGCVPARLHLHLHFDEKYLQGGGF